MTLYASPENTQKEENMGSFSIWHILILASVVILLFGRGKISAVMGDVGAGIRNFRKELRSPPDQS